MKKILAMLLAMLTVCSFAACGDSEKKSLGGNDESSVSEKENKDDEDSEEIDYEKELEEAQKKIEELEAQAEAEKEKAESEIRENIEDAEEEREKAEEEISESEEAINEIIGEDDSDDEDADGSEFVMGSVDGNVYTSSFSGLKFTAPDGYVFSTEEEILEMMNIGTEIMGDKGELYMELAEQGSIYDMVAQDPVTGDNVMIMYENLGAYGSAVADAYDVDTYLEAVELQFEGLESSGIIYEKANESDVTLGGREFRKVEFSCHYETYDLTTNQAYYIAKDGDYMTVVIASLGVNSAMSDVSEFEQYFSAN
ncbi:MAG: hypothetical protein IJX77_05870 [Ruminococcus sp.]|nr:hypothetical protein [Ruminococcus sp.]